MEPKRDATVRPPCRQHAGRPVARARVSAHSRLTGLGRTRRKGGDGRSRLDETTTFGWSEGRDPGPNFDTTSYLVANPDVAAAGANPLQHYLEFGINEGRVIA